MTADAQNEVDDKVGEVELIVFLGANCAPSRLMSAALRQLETGNSGLPAPVRLDAAKDRALAASFAVDATPTVLLVRDGRVIKRHKGAMTGADLRQWVARPV